MIVKLQYKDFEPGEFTGIKDRICEETMEVIETFPWEEQREHLRVGLTTPSVTMESPTGEFLKLALYYSGKFILYFVDSRHHEFSRVLTTSHDGVDPIRAFFGNSSSVPDGFLRQHTFLQHVDVHFRTGDFTYRMTAARLSGPIALICVYLLVPIVYTIGIMAPGKSHLWPFLIPGFGFLIFAIVQIVLLVNHYRSAHGQVLIVSLGKRDFFYGPAASPEAFNKADIREIITHGMRAKGGYPALTRVEILFKNGRSISLSCLTINREVLVAKFPGCPQSEDKVFLPFI